MADPGTKHGGKVRRLELDDVDHVASPLEERESLP
jgi:hypothetical protein